MGQKYLRQSSLLGFKGRVLDFGAFKGRFPLNLFTLFVFLALGAFIRFYRLPELAAFVGDQGRDYLAARDILLSNKLTLIGPQTSIPYLYLGPFFYYFLAFFLWLGNFNPVWPAYGTVLFGVLAIYLIYLLGRDLFDEKTGLISAFFYAISPFAIIQSRIALHPSIYPVFVIIFLISLSRILSAKNFFSKELLTSYFLLLTSFIIAVQLHLSAVLLIPIFVLSFEQVKLKSRFFLKSFLTISGILIIWKIFRHSPFTPVSFWMNIFEEIFSFEFTFGAVISLGLTGLGFFTAFSDFGTGAKLLKISLLVTVLGLTIKNSSEHYFNLFLPIVILILSLGLTHFLNHRHGKTFILSISIFFLIVNGRSLITSSYFSQIYSLGLKERIKLADFIVKDAGDNSYVLKRCGPLWDYPSTNLNYEYLTWWLGNKSKRQSKSEEKKVIYYIFEPREAWETKEGCQGIRINEGKIFEFEQARVLKDDASGLQKGKKESNE